MHRVDLYEAEHAAALDRVLAARARVVQVPPPRGAVPPASPPRSPPPPLPAARPAVVDLAALPHAAALPAEGSLAEVMREAAREKRQLRAQRAAREWRGKLLATEQQLHAAKR